jgi:Fic family protein
MTYVLEKTIKGKKYFYLVKNVRVNGGWKKFTVYIGRGKLGKRYLAKLKRKYSKILDQRVATYLKSVDPLFGLLSEKQVAELEKIRVVHKRARKAMSAAARERWYEWFSTIFTYNTNAIEGSTINLRETSTILFEGLTPSGKTMREVREVENHRRAFDYAMAYKGDVNRVFICKLHGLLSCGILERTESGVFRKVQVFVRGAEVIPPKPEALEKQFKELMLWYRKNKKKYHPVIVGAYMHTAFEGIHPFVDYNGRTGRLLLNFILMKNGFPPIVIEYKKRAEYYVAIQAAINGKLKPFVRLVYRYLKKSG